MCEHEIRLKGIRLSDDNYGRERKISIWYCPECKESWDRD